MVEEGAVGGVDVRGFAPGTRETDLLDPVNTVQEIHSLAAEVTYKAIIRAATYAEGIPSYPGVRDLKKK